MMHTSSHLPVNVDGDGDSDTEPPRVRPGHVYTSCYCEENIYLLAKQFVDDLPTHGWDVHVVFVSNAAKLAALWQQKAREDVVVWDYHVVLVLRRAPSSASASESEDGATPAISPGREGERAGGQAQAVAWVYDFDTRLPLPCPAQEYVNGTFPYSGSGDAPSTIPELYVSLFRVVPVRAFLDFFASDRSHMLAKGRTDAYTSPPPPYPPIRGAKACVANNLMASYVDMRAPESASRPIPAESTSERPGRAEHETDDDEALQTSAAGAYGRVMDLREWQTWLNTPPTDQPHRS